VFLHVSSEFSFFLFFFCVCACMRECVSGALFSDSVIGTDIEDAESFLSDFIPL
jgi:hypothetical protein